MHDDRPIFGDVFWWFKRGDNFVRYEARQSGEAAYELRIVEMDGTERVERFENEDDLINITECLLKRGFRKDDVVKVLGGNFLRVLRAVLKPRDRMIGSLGIPVPASAGAK